MLYLIWSVLNISLGIFFLFLIVNFIAKGKIIFNNRFKCLSIAVMIFGVVQILFSTNSEEKNNKIIFKDYIPQPNQKLQVIKAEENLNFDIILYIKYVKENDGLILLESNSSTIGFVSGFDWEYNSIEIKNFQENQSISYLANGVLHWNLFGFNIYSQGKTFHGTIE